MQSNTKVAGIAAMTAFLLTATAAVGEVSDETLKSLGAADAIETSAGTLEFKDGVPTEATAQKAFDAVAFARALEASTTASAAPRHWRSSRASRTSGPSPATSSSSPS